MTARAAVHRVGVQDRFAAICGVPVAIAKACRTRDSARSAGTRGHRIGAVRAGVSARAAVVHVGVGLRFAPVQWRQIAVGEAVRAGLNRAGSHGALFGRVGRRARVTARSAIRLVGRRRRARAHAARAAGSAAVTARAAVVRVIAGRDTCVATAGCSDAAWMRGRTSRNTCACRAHGAGRAIGIVHAAHAMVRRRVALHRRRPGSAVRVGATARGAAVHRIAELSRWAGIHRRGEAAHAHSVRRVADRSARVARAACVRLTTRVRVGPSAVAGVGSNGSVDA